MLDKIVLSQDRTQATLYFTNREPFNLYHSEGLVLDLVALFLAPYGASQDVTWASYTSSLEDTAVIDISKLDAA